MAALVRALKGLIRFVAWLLGIRDVPAGWDLNWEERDTW